jgi:hypothetical protein
VACDFASSVTAGSARCLVSGSSRESTRLRFRPVQI